MVTQSQETKQTYMKMVGLLLVFAYGIAITGLFILDIRVIFEPPLLLPITNTIFTAIIPLIVAFFAASSYLKNGTVSVFLMGCGMLSFGVFAALAGWLIGAQNGANINVTIYNTGALLGSLFHICGAVLSSKTIPPWKKGEEKQFIAFAYGGILIFAVLFTIATIQHIVPPFFIQGLGPTVLRQIVLGLAILLYALSAAFFMNHYLRSRSDFLYWYSLCLAMLSLGLFAFYIQKVVGSPIGWAGRTSNYVGTIFALVSIWCAVQSGRSKGLTLEDVISGFFMDAEANYSSLVETATDAIISFDQEDRIILWNLGAERIFGYTKEEAIGASFLGLLIPKESLAVMKELICVCKSIPDQSESQRATEIETKLKDDSLLPVEISAFAVKLPNGWACTCIMRDISERKRAQEALRENKAQLDLALLSAHMGTWYWDIITEKRYFDEQVCHLLGINAATFTGAEEEFFAVVHPDDRETIRAGLSRTLEHNAMYEVEYRVVWSNKSVHHISSRGMLVRDDAGRPVRINGIIWDITERKQTEEKLREAHRRLDEIIEFLPDATFVIDADSKVIAWNRAIEQMTGVSKAEMIGKGEYEYALPFYGERRPIFIDLALLPDVEFEKKEYDIAQRSADTIYGETYVPKTYGGKGAYLSGAASRLRDAAGNIVGAIESIRDITERKKIEEVLRKNLEELDFANKELESFSYSVSHDLKAPLRAIDGYARMILKKQGDKFDADTLDKFSVIRSSTHTMGQLIEDLLTLSRLGRKYMSLAPMDMDILMKDAWKEVQENDRERNMKFKENSMPRGYGDRALIKQVLVNLLSNAVKFTKYEDAAEIVVGGYAEGNEHVYYVRDNGVGFDMAYYDKLFAVFQRLHSTDNFEGTGIGLALVQRIIHRHGGRAWAEGKVGEGATFYFSLPSSHTIDG